ASAWYEPPFLMFRPFDGEEMHAAVVADRGLFEAVRLYRRFALSADKAAFGVGLPQLLVCLLVVEALHPVN
ncbi:unnamed protein product, partial [marine sediment metagenome]